MLFNPNYCLLGDTMIKVKWSNLKYVFCNWSAYLEIKGLNSPDDTIANLSLVCDNPLHSATNLKRVCYEVSIAALMDTCYMMKPCIKASNHG